MCDRDEKYMPIPVASSHNLVSGASNHLGEEDQDMCFVKMNVFRDHLCRCSVCLVLVTRTTYFVSTCILHFCDDPAVRLGEGSSPPIIGSPALQGLGHVCIFLL